MSLDFFEAQFQNDAVFMKHPVSAIGKRKEEYPVFDHARNFDDTPVLNLAIERQCGLVDHRRKKLQNLANVSRSMILGRTRDLMDRRVSRTNLSLLN